MNIRRYKVRNVHVYPDYNSLGDTVKPPLRDTVDRVYFHYDLYKVRSLVVRDAIFIQPNQYYIKKEYDYTIARISDLGLYKFISIRYSITGRDSLDCFIRLTPSKKQDVQVQLELNNIETNIGSAVKVSYRNRNWLKAANIITRIGDGVEVRR
jgi:outer membrane protein assembly factor BamA